jgi:transcriptional regulator with XRE-family HTH domain
MAMSSKSVEDLEAGARIRAHLRQQMKERGIDKAELARRIHADNGNTTRLLKGERVPGAGQILRICRGLKINPTRLLEENPPEEFFKDDQLPVVRKPKP